MSFRLNDPPRPIAEPFQNISNHFKMRNLYPSNLLAALAARMFGRPLVVTVHVGAIPYQNRFLRGLVGALYRTTARTV